MNPLERFLHTYLHYTVTQRLFEDTCRQLRDCEGTVERRVLVDEALRLAMSVSELADDAEALLPEARSYADAHDIGDPDIADALVLIANSIREDRARATSFAMFLTARRMGGARRARVPQVANPMRFSRDDDADLREDTLEEDGPDDCSDDSSEGDDIADDGPEDYEQEAGDLSDDDGSGDGCDEIPFRDEGPSVYRRRIIQEENARAEDPFIFYPDDGDREPRGNPLMEESRRIALEQRGERAAVTSDELREMRRRMDEGRRAHGHRIGPAGAPGLRFPLRIRARHPRSRPHPCGPPPSRPRHAAAGAPVHFAVHPGPVRP